MSQARKWLWKRNDNILNFRFKWLIGVDADGCVDEPWQIICTCAMVLPPK